MREMIAHRLSWAVLALLLVATWALAALHDRSSWPSLVGDEATYAMQAASLASDFDLRYERRDYDRFVAAWQRPPEGLILQSRDEGDHLVYGKPFLYALFIAPFVALAPVRGAALANALLLTLAAVALGRALSQRHGPWGPLWAAVAVFASVTFGYVFWVHADLFLFTCATVAFCLASGAEGATPAGGSTGSGFARFAGRPRDNRAPLPEVWGDAESPDGGRWWSRVPPLPNALRFALCGAGLGAVIAFRPLYAPLLLPLVLLLPRYRVRPARRRTPEEDLDATLSSTFTGTGGVAVRPTRAWLWAAGGLVAVLAVSALAQWASGGSWSGYAGERQGFYQRTGFPAVDFPAADWDRSIESWGNTSWVHTGMFDLQTSPSLVLWNSLYFFVGENIGVLPYFLPALPLLLLGGWSRPRAAAVVAVALAVVAFFLLRPFNFYGGAGALANRYFLPLYPALLIGGTRRLPAWGAVLTAALAAPFLLPLWSTPTAFPVKAGGDGYHHVSAAAREYLPWESTQSHLPRASEDVVHNGLWLRFTDAALAPVGSDGLSLALGTPAEILVGSPRALSRLGLSLGPGADQPTVEGAEIVQQLFRPDGSAGYVLELDDVSYLHPMWWTEKPYFLYRLVLRADPATGAGDRASARLEPLGQ